jgi:23S rRNA (pseudouridine1915-N3)-methyltransferase
MKIKSIIIYQYINFFILNLDIIIISTGQLEKYQRLWFDEYKKRCKFDVNLIEIVVKEKLKERRIEKESEKITQYLEIYKSRYIILMEIDGVILTSDEISKIFFDLKKNLEVKNLIFIIGGSYGVNSNVKKLANFKLSFGKNTWPHNLMKVMLMEQIFRAQSIIENKDYHH